MPNGLARDAEFAHGFLEGIRGDVQFLDEPDEHSRPVAQLGGAFGRNTGDFGCVCEGTNGEKVLLVVEREGSGPGNERNVWRWFFIAKTPQWRIQLRCGGQSHDIEYDRVVCLLVFGRSASWPVNDYRKTVAFCKELADFLSDVPNKEGTPYVGLVIAPDKDEVVEDWDRYGRTAATEFLWNDDLAARAGIALGPAPP